MESPTITRHIPELDGLRGIAIIMVMVFHFIYQSHIGALTFGNTVGGRFGNIAWSGVDLFFVLSGFLIGGILIDNRRSSSYFTTFYARRILRIVPVYLVILLAYAAFFVIPGRTLLGPPSPWYVYATFTENIWMMWGVSTPRPAFFGIAWSLALEEQFYLTFPLLVHFVPRKHLVKVVAGLAVACSAARTIGIYTNRINGYHAYHLPWFRADALLIGVLCALAVRNDGVREVLSSNLAILYGSGAACLIAIFPMQFDFWTLPTPAMAGIGLTLLPMLFACILLAVVLRPGSLMAGALRFPPLMYIGTIAYCTYLIHRIIPHLLNLAIPTLARTPDGYRLIMLSSTVISIVIASLSWHFFESPLVRLGRTLIMTRPRIVPLSERPNFQI
jgi:peptidoglycan/LPS O-acetylase OafA/YrhL